MRKAWIYSLTLFFCMAGLTGILRMAAAAGENAVNPIQGRVWELEQLASSREQFPGLGCE